MVEGRISVREGQSEVGIKNHDYSHGGLDIGNGVLSTNTVLPVILQVHLLGRGYVVASAQPATGQTVIVVGVIHVEMIDVQSDVLLFLSRLATVEAVFEAAGGQQKDQEYTKGAGTHCDVQQRHAETVRTVDFFLVETRRTMTYTVAP